MDFEWDSTKAKTNLVKHQVSFEEAKTVFDDRFFIIFDDPDHSVDENRFLILGTSINGRLLVVAYTERAETVRLISARRATRQEQKHYEEDL